MDTFETIEHPNAIVNMQPGTVVSLSMLSIDALTTILSIQISIL
jgi:hypothetical protein